MDFADDVAYSVHDLEDGVVAGRIDLARLDRDDDRAAVWATVRDWYLPGVSDEVLDASFAKLRGIGSWPDAVYDGSRGALAALKNLTSDVIGLFCGSVQYATREVCGNQRLVRYAGDLVVPDGTDLEIAVLKGIAAHYVMQAEDRVALQERQRTLLTELFEALSSGNPDHFDAMFRMDFLEAKDDAARTRVVADQIASLTDASAVSMHRRIC